MTVVLEDGDILDTINHHDMWLFTCMPFFSSSAWLEVYQELDWGLRGLGHLWHHASSRYEIYHFYAKFQLSSIISSESRTPILKVICGGRWLFLTAVLEDGVILNIMNHHNVIFHLCAKFQLSSMIRSESRTHTRQGHTWRTLMVPDWRLRGLGHLWHVISAW